MKKRRRFRVNARKFFLTYSQVPAELTAGVIVEQLLRNLSAEQYVIGEEYHEDGGKHFHVVLLSKSKLDIRSARKFYIKFEGATYKCNVSAVQNLTASIKYVCKSGTYETNIKNVSNGGFVPLPIYLEGMSKEIGVIKTLKFYK